MKILYAIQATGNGHISRANELMPHLQKYGQVDVFLSGSNSSLLSHMPVTYRSKGVSLFYGNTGALDYWKMAKSLAPLRILKEAKNLPVEKYDVIINDFESITALACKIKKKPFLHFGHQASFASANTPRPAKKDITGEFLLQHYAGSRHSVGLHFKQYDTGIFSPVLKHNILTSEPSNMGHITVYLCHYNDSVVCDQLHKVNHVEFHLFSKLEKEIRKVRNVIIFPINDTGFNQSMVSSAGVITGAGFETPSEALYLNKRLMCLPIKGQYEQLCNAAALKEFGVKIMPGISDDFGKAIRDWLSDPLPEKLTLSTSTKDIVEIVIEKSLAIRNEDPSVSEEHLLQPDLSFA